MELGILSPSEFDRFMEVSLSANQDWELYEENMAGMGLDAPTEIPADTFLPQIESRLREAIGLTN